MSLVLPAGGTLDTLGILELGLGWPGWRWESGAREGEWCGGWCGGTLEGRSVGSKRDDIVMEQWKL